MNINYSGDLFRRILLNKQRLGDKIYAYPGVFETDSKWPGDHEGRALLGLCSLFWALTGVKEVQEEIFHQMKKMFDHLPQYTNEDGYFGSLWNGEMADEQQLSGNSWYLRALTSYYEITGDSKVIPYIHNIINRYLIPVAPFYKRYSTGHREMGGVGGHIVESSKDGWRYSSDIGCAFIMLDGMTAAYKIVPDRTLRSVIEELIEQFVALDYVGLKFQTHATLSCSRGIMRFFELSGEQKYLRYVARIFDDYLTYGKTLDYGNFNWFGREDTWTEPCAIVDSFILAKKLYTVTTETRYLEIANRIYLNAFRVMQRDNGGAGCSTCLRPRHPETEMFLYEAWFCCSMRLGEGLKEVATFCFENDHEIFLPILHEGQYRTSSGMFSVKGDVYDGEKVEIELLNIDKKVIIYLHPDFVALGSGFVRKDKRLMIDPKTSYVSFMVTLNYHKEEECFFCGDMLLVRADETRAPAFIKIDGSDYGRVTDFSKIIGETEVKKVKQRL